jgi:tetratricopeptide (TPR) repeat protein
MHTRPRTPSAWRPAAMAAALACAVIGLTLLSACTSTPTGSANKAAAGSPNTAFEQQELDRANLLTRQGKLAEAALSWEVLTVLRPDVPRYADRLHQVRDQIERSATELANNARQAQRRGALDEAAQRYLALLAIKPDDSAAAEALRGIERERIKRDSLGRLSRVTVAGHMVQSAARSDGEAANALSAERNDLEHAALLAGQGDFDDAIALLSPRLKAKPKDDAARALLADVYYRKAQGLADVDQAGAITAIGLCLQLDGSHASARSLLAQLSPAKARPSTAPASRRKATPKPPARRPVNSAP